MQMLELLAELAEPELFVLPNCHRHWQKKIGLEQLEHPSHRKLEYHADGVVDERSRVAHVDQRLRRQIAEY